ncbi:MAG: SusC/RagA family TonB-linked outer membrane protein [Gemmatimonadaceae bacterium]|nr:SusC/RagA family TonB-linked outer membrane protein [Gemmatimonadaceae bacterium]
MPALKGALARAFAVALLVGLPVQAFAQAATISGRVTTTEGQPIVGANVLIPSLNAGTTSGTNGVYQFSIPESQANGQRVTLTARFIGYTPISRQITLSTGTQTQNFELKTDPFRLEEMVVTGVAEAVSVKKTAMSVGRLSEDQIKQVPASSPLAALAGKVSGARIAIGTGNPGAAPTIRLRGSTNLSVGNNNPLVLVDGVITTNSLADIDANDIESVEVLKGAAAASFYGSNAANGVVNITTKRGKNLQDNKISFSSRSEYGQSGVYKFVPLSQHHNFALNADGSIQTTTGGQRVLDPDGIADNAYPATGPDAWRNQLETWLQDGSFYLQNFQLGLRRGSTNLNSSFTTDHNQGILPFTSGQHRQNLRLNVDQALGAKADFSASFTYGLNNNDYDPTSTDGWFALLQAPPDIDLKNPNPTVSDVPYFPLLPDTKAKNARGNPLWGLKNNDYSLRRERILGSFALRYRPFSWLNLDANYGTDRANIRSRTYQYRGYLNEGGVATTGFLSNGSNNNLAENLQFNATTKKLLFNNLLSTTRVTYLRETLDNISNNAQGSKLTVSQVPDLDALDPTQNAISSGMNTQRTINYMVAQAFDFKDRYIIDALYRRDGSSLFGPNERWQDFYRIAGAYRISEDFKLPGVQELKIRAARGTAGLRPDFTDQYETYSLSGGQISKQQLGNRNLKPAIQTENEYGLNVQFLDRFDLEVVRADRLTKGAFLSVPLSLAQSGGFLRQVQNAADVSAQTWEVSLQTRVIDTDAFSYSFSLTGDNTRQKIDHMEAAPFRRNATGAQGQDVFYYKSGEKLGIIYGTRWVRSFEQLKENPANASANPADYVVNSDGYLVRAANLGKTTEAPIAYVNAAGATQHVIGDVNPDFTFGWANNLRYKSLTFYALLDGVKGGDIYNFTKQWMYQDERHGTQDQSGRPMSERRPLAFYSAGLYNGLVANDHFVEDGSYARLRELSVAYNLNSNLLSKFGLNRTIKGAKVAFIGRNVFTWTKYTGFDPEVTAGGDFNFRIDGFRYPNFRTFTGQIELQF